MQIKSTKIANFFRETPYFKREFDISVSLETYLIFIETAVECRVSLCLFFSMCPEKGDVCGETEGNLWGSHRSTWRKFRHIKTASYFQIDLLVLDATSLKQTQRNTQSILPIL